MNILQSNFKENDIPYGAFERLGISKVDILTKIEKSDLQALLSGKRTGLFKVSGIDQMGEKFTMKCKFSLQRKEDGSAGLCIHPVRNRLTNDIGLKPKELEKLNSGHSICKNIEGERFLIQLDKDTNELLRVKTKDINIPSYIQDTKLNSSQKEKLRQGKEIDIDTNTEKVQAKIDLNTPSGITLSNFEQKQKEAYDFHNHDVTGFLQTDRNRDEYLSSKTPKL